MACDGTTAGSRAIAETRKGGTAVGAEWGADAEIAVEVEAAGTTSAWRVPQTLSTVAGAAVEGVHAMTEAAAVEALRARLTAAQSEAAAARGRAEQAADALRRAPSVDGVEVRDRTRALVEVADLEVERLRRDLAEAEQAARGEECQRTLDEHAAASTVVQEHEKALFEGLEMIEAALADLTDLRNQTRRRQGRLRANGWDGNSLQLPMKPSRDFVRRIEALPRAYAKVTHPIMAG